jgi:rhodanese-related sulfurtransferase
MQFLKSIKQMLTKPTSPPVRPARLTPPPDPEPEEVVVPEIKVSDLLLELGKPTPPLLVDVRELYEWQQVHIADSLHIPMNEIPRRLTELPKDANLVIFCAHGSRSYGVAHYLLEQGYQARNLAGGITQWHVQGGAVVVGKQ